jgi:hypothetical protein
MVFSFYSKLSAAQKCIYQRSDSNISVPFHDAETLQQHIPMHTGSLLKVDVVQVEDICRKITLGITSRLSIKPLRIKVLAVRPSACWGELHGLYEPANGQASAVITLWLRTTKQRRVVAFKSFLRTLLHELCHHLDYKIYRLPDSFHTEGFYKREASLFHQLMPEAQQSFLLNKEKTRNRWMTGLNIGYRRYTELPWPCGHDSIILPSLSRTYNSHIL